ncbi:MAG: asparaginase [Gemmatimonadales bacterium]
MPSFVDVLRDDLVESRHVVSIAVVHADGTLRAWSGDPDTVAFWRSCAKPFQAIPSITLGASEAFGFGDEAHALQCASHNGEPRHVELARRMLAAAGASERDLHCGPHASLNDDVAKEMSRRGEQPTKAHNNCSGKHAGMIALARHKKWGDGYARPDHPVQQQCLAEVAKWAGLHVTGVPHATDGCGVPCFALPLRNMALAYARLGAVAEGDHVDSVGEDARAAAGQLVASVRKHPFLIAGTARLDTELLDVTAGRVIAKVGAEGVYSAMIPEQRLGIALKVEDGAHRALGPALLGLLDVLTPGSVPGLDQHRSPAIKNTLGATVGRVVPRIALQHGATK